MVVTLLNLLACGAEEVDSAQVLPWAYPSEEVALLTVEEVEPELQAVVDRTRTFHATPIVEGYAASMSAQSPPCPTWYARGVESYWYDVCETPEGARFNGYMFGLQSEDTPVTDYTGMALWGAASVTQADGRVFHLGGRVESTRALTTTTRLYVSRAIGTFAWSGSEAEGTWLAQGYALDLEMSGLTLDDGTDRRALQLQGGISGFDGALTAVRFEGTAATSARDGECLPEPSGGISVRDAQARWYTVRLDGPEADDTAACDGCGRLMYENQDLGAVCLDYSALTTWTADSPW